MFMAIKQMVHVRSVSAVVLKYCGLKTAHKPYFFLAFLFYTYLYKFKQIEIEKGK